MEANVFPSISTRPLRRHRRRCGHLKQRPRSFMSRSLHRPLHWRQLRLLSWQTCEQPWDPPSNAISWRGFQRRRKNTTITFDRKPKIVGAQTKNSYEAKSQRRAGAPQRACMVLECTVSMGSSGTRRRRQRRRRGYVAWRRAGGMVRVRGDASTGMRGGVDKEASELGRNREQRCRAQNEQHRGASGRRRQSRSEWQWGGGRTADEDGGQGVGATANRAASHAAQAAARPIDNLCCPTPAFVAVCHGLRVRRVEDRTESYQDTKSCTYEFYTASPSLIPFMSPLIYFQTVWPFQNILDASLPCKAYGKG